MASCPPPRQPIRWPSPCPSPPARHGRHRLQGLALGQRLTGELGAGGEPGRRGLPGRLQEGTRCSTPSPRWHPSIARGPMGTPAISGGGHSAAPGRGQVWPCPGDGELDPRPDWPVPSILANNRPTTLDPGAFTFTNYNRFHLTTYHLLT